MGLHTGKDDNGVGKEGGHAGQDDNGAEVLDSLGGLHLLDQLLLVEDFYFTFAPKLKKCYKPMVKKSNPTKTYSL